MWASPEWSGTQTERIAMLYTVETTHDGWPRAMAVAHESYSEALLNATAARKILDCVRIDITEDESCGDGVRFRRVVRRWDRVNDRWSMVIDNLRSVGGAR
jgi:hypothetical protein